MLRFCESCPVRGVQVGEDAVEVEGTNNEITGNFVQNNINYVRLQISARCLKLLNWYRVSNWEYYSWQDNNIGSSCKAATTADRLGERIESLNGVELVPEGRGTGSDNRTSPEFVRAKDTSQFSLADSSLSKWRVGMVASRLHITSWKHAIGQWMRNLFIDK